MLLRKDLRRAVEPSWVTLFRSGLGLTPRTDHVRLTVRFDLKLVYVLDLDLGPVGGSIARVTDAVCTRYFLVNRLWSSGVLVGFNT